jgi:ABC-type enterochelin transport system ATPase subunit
MVMLKRRAPRITDKMLIDTANQRLAQARGLLHHVADITTALKVQDLYAYGRIIAALAALGKDTSVRKIDS